MVILYQRTKNHERKRNLLLQSLRLRNLRRQLLPTCENCGRVIGRELAHYDDDDYPKVGLSDKLAGALFWGDYSNEERGLEWALTFGIFGVIIILSRVLDKLGSVEENKK